MTQLGETQRDLHHDKETQVRVHLGCRYRVREDAETSAHSTERPGARLTPAPKFRKDPSIEFQTLRVEE